MPAGLILFALSWTPSIIAQQHEAGPDPVLLAATKAEIEGRLADAENILLDAINSAEPSSQGAVVIYLKRLSNIYSRTGQLPDALKAAQRALELDQQALGRDSSAAMSDAANIAAIYDRQGKTDEAEQILQQAIESMRQSTDRRPQLTIQLEGNLGGLYAKQHRWAEAEPVLEDALKACPSYPRLFQPCAGIQSTLNAVYRNEGRPTEPGLQNAGPVLPAELDNLEKSARQSFEQGNYSQAELLYKQVIAWIEQHPKFETTNPVRTVWVTNLLPGEYTALGQVLERQGLSSDAEVSYKKAIEFQEANVDSKHPMLVDSFNFSGLLNLYRSEGRLAEMEPIVESALEIQEKYLGSDSLRVADTLLTLGEVYAEEGKRNAKKYGDAVIRYERALKIEETNLGTDNRQLLRVLDGELAALIGAGDDARASQVRQRIDAIRHF